MAEQQYSNLASSILASAYTAGDTTLTLQSGTGSLFPVIGDFTVAIDSPPSFFLYCTARATDVITVNSSASEGTSASNEPIGTPVTQVITSGVLNNIRNDMNKFGLDADLSTSGMHLGDRYNDTDQSYYYIYGTSGWQQFTSGTGSSGTSGTSGVGGSSGTSGVGGSSGTSGVSGSSGTSALGFTSGTSGTSGISGGSSISIGTYSSLSTSGLMVGDLYRTTDGPYELIYNGSNWQAFAFSVPAIVPPISGWTQVNFGTSQVTAIGGAFNITFQSAGSNILRSYVQPSPGSLYTVTIGVKQLLEGVGIGLYNNSSGLSEVLFWGTDLKLHGFNYDSGFNYTSRAFTDLNFIINPETVWLRIIEDASYRTFYTSFDGIYFTQQAQISAGSFLIPTHIGLGSDVSEIPNTGALVFSFSLTSP